MSSNRQRMQSLNRVLESHAAWEKRTLADLRLLGFKFTTIEQAFRWRAAQQTLARMNADDVIELVARLEMNRIRKEES